MNFDNYLQISVNRALSKHIYLLIHIKRFYLLIICISCINKKPYLSTKSCFLSTPIKFHLVNFNKKYFLKNAFF
jgi:hypothetical protein